MSSYLDRVNSNRNAEENHPLNFLPSAIRNVVSAIVPDSIEHTVGSWVEYERIHQEVQAEIDGKHPAHPELLKSATVSHENSIPEEEQEFRRERKAFMKDAFARFIGVSPEEVHVDDIPVIAVTGSGGGFKAMIGTTGYLKGMHDSGLFDCVMYMAGVSGSCWTLSNFYTAARCSVPALLEHYKQALVPHPASPIHIPNILSKDIRHRVRLAFDGMTIKRISQLPRGVVDTYGCLMNCHFQGDYWEGAWEPDHFRLSRHAKYLKGGKAPMPIYTCIRHERPWARKFDPDLPREEWEQLQKQYESNEDKNHLAGSKEHAHNESAWWQWFEITPFQVGCDELHGWVPTWAFGRRFVNDVSVENLPEQNFSLVVGLTGSAMCAPFTTTVQTFQRSETTSHFQEKMKEFLGTLIQPDANPLVKQLLAIHPFHSSYNWNFLYEDTPEKTPPGVRNSKRIQLIDAGADNNQPLYPLTRLGRDVDVAFVFDSSVDVERNIVTPDVETFAKRKGLSVTLRSPPPAPQESLPANVPKPKNTAESLRQKYENRYCQVYQLDPIDPAGTHPEYGNPLASKGFQMLYMPILPNPEVPEFEPNSFGFGQLQYTSEQVQDLAKCASLNWKQEEARIREVLRSVWQEKRRARLAAH
ncbi:acyl transferase/acyl hydrolase/lysophospholipase [Polychytrium aggregatum]|uniref:acyl transferase/acyl hydrolase/lysophospholipase n=1 Tax=Polychytrium aggregatum TaxID=110093 RepID=UPI0022FEA0C9|nr:acyl transferase/acyl hydrolase/lysophospholipase [Polychytrium aggregatum]KAI9203417.1 acyl transferase/acyl hydrolase/lysophospholipase [Polychytrium aggregatum]